MNILYINSIHRIKSLQRMGKWPIEEETPISAEFVIYYCRLPALLLVCSSVAAETVNERKWWIWKGLFAAGVTILVTECFQWTKYSPIMLSESEAAINQIQQEQLSHWGCQHVSFQHPVSLKSVEELLTVWNRNCSEWAVQSVSNHSHLLLTLPNEQTSQ